MSYDCSIGGDHLDNAADLLSPKIDVPFSLVAWIHRTAAEWADTTDGTLVFIGDDFVDQNSSTSLNHGGFADTVRSRIWDSGGGSDVINKSHADGTYDDLWVVCIAVYASDTDRKLYIEDSTSPGTDTTNRDLGGAVMDSIRIGDKHNTGSPCLGLVAEVAIFDKALSAAEIDALQTGAETGPAPNTVASADCIGYWPLDTDQSTHADQSGNGGPTLTVQSAAPFDADHPTITAGAAQDQSAVFKRIRGF